MKAVLLAGGLGTRMREETEFRPKPMVEIGGKPVLWHIMKVLSAQGIKEFIICAGYKGEQIKNYFFNYKLESMDFTVNLGDHSKTVFHGSHSESDWKVTVVDTGPRTNTGGRLVAVQKYLDHEPFLVTYGDGIADVSLASLLEFHKNQKTIATMTTARPTSRFGVVEISPEQTVTKFREKPILEDWVNIGYFIFESQIFDYLDENSVLEEQPLAALSEDSNLSAFRHHGFWQPMDTYREAVALNEIWGEGEAPWKIWK
jgi:glucose-1-phosphate cytidylyltransferase